MIYYSTNRHVPEVDLGQAMLQGQAADKGLFLPRPPPRLTGDLMRRARDLSYPALATELIAPYATGTFSHSEIEEICHDAYDFAVPIEHVDGPRHLLRLDQGPTASFKDFAARFMGRALGRLVRAKSEELLILTATSGDTGSAVAHAFLGVDGVKILVLFPREEVSNRQRKQMTTLGDNVATIAVEGKFDDCQALVKRAFADPDLAGINLSSANSINVGRLIPQSVYYVYSASRLADIAGGERVIFSVPSGNFGDLLGGVLAFKAGLPLERFVVATNSNDEVPRFVATGKYDKIVPSRVCISNAMNVGHPSNLARLVDLYGGQMNELGELVEPPAMEQIRAEFHAVSISEERTREVIGDVWNAHRAMLEPHGAVGWAGLLDYLEHNPAAAATTAISLETAHPAKFPEELTRITGQDPDLPPSLEGLDDRPEHFAEMALDYGAFRSYLEENYRT